MSRLWSKLFGREHEEAAELEPATAPAETVELQAVEPEPVPEPETLAPPEVAPQPHAAEPEPEPQPEPEPEPQLEPEPQAEALVEERADGPLTAADVEARLGELLESLGSAHRRPFVRNG